MYKIYKGYVLYAQSKDLSLDDFLEIMRVEPTKFGSTVLQTMYAAIYIWSRDLKLEYTNYYSVEYDNIEQYLNYMVGIDFSGIDLEKEHLFYFKPSYSFLNLDYEDNYLDTVLNILEKIDED